MKSCSRKEVSPARKSLSMAACLIMLTVFGCTGKENSWQKIVDDGNADLVNGNIGAAITLFRLAGQRAADDRASSEDVARCHIAEADALTLNGKYKAAEQVLTETQPLLPDQPAADALARVFQSVQEFLPGRSSGDQFLRAQFHERLGFIDLRVAQYEDSAVELNKALQLTPPAPPEPAVEPDPKCDKAKVRQERDLLIGKVHSDQCELYTQTGDLQRAEEAGKAAVTELNHRVHKDQFSRPTSIAYANALNAYAMFLQKSNNLPLAEEMARNAMRLWRLKVGVCDPRFVAATNTLISIYCDEQHFEKAQALLDGLYPIERRYLRFGHPDSTRSVLMNAILLSRSTHGQTDLKAIFDTVLKADVTSYGENHPQIASDFDELAAWEAAAGNSFLAQEHRKQASYIRETALSSKSKRQADASVPHNL